MKVDVLCIGPITGETIYTTKTLDPNILPKRIRAMMQSHVSTRAQDVVFGCGGAGYIAALGLTRLGIKTALAARVGQDSIGCEAVRKLESEGVRTSLVIQTPQAATTMMTLLRSPQDDSFEISYVAPGGYDKKCISNFSKITADWVYVSGPFTDLGELKNILSWCKKSGAQSMVRLTQSDIVQARRAIKILSKATICVFELEDAELLTHQLDIESALLALRESGLKTVILQDGTAALGAIHDGFVYQAKGGRKPTVINTTGVPEVVGPAMLAHLTRNSDFGAALDFGLTVARSVGGYIGSESGLLNSLAHRTGKVYKKFI